MSISCGSVIDIIEELAPPSLALPNDPIGLQLGGRSAAADRVYFALELNDEVVADALAFGAQLVVVHHTPVYFPFRELSDENYYARLTLALAKGGAALYAAHTNLDRAAGGVNDVLADLLGLEERRALDLREAGKAYPMGRIGRLAKAVSLGEYAAFVAKKLSNPCLRYVGSSDRPVLNVACLGGAGASAMAEAKKQGADLLVTGDLRHHEALDALGMDICVIDAGHFSTESPAMARLAAFVGERLPQAVIRVSEINTNPFHAVRG